MLSDADIEQRITQHEREYAEFRREVAAIHREVVSLHYPLPTEWHITYGFQHTCHGYMMVCFSWVDAISKYWTGGKDIRHPTLPRSTKWSAQTERMVNFMEMYLSSNRHAHWIAVQLWRHGLMHESKPREIVDKNGKHYGWLLVWEMEAAAHYTVQYAPKLPSGQSYDFDKIQAGLVQLVADFDGAFARYYADLRKSASLLRNAYEMRETEMDKPFDP